MRKQNLGSGKKGNDSSNNGNETKEIEDRRFFFFNLILD